jgi:hypothetical protein
MQRAVDERTLLPGEDTDSVQIDDALHWIQVYAELLRFKDSMLAAAERAAEGLTDSARADISIDQDLLRAQAQRYRARSEFWFARAGELSDGQPARAVGGTADGTGRTEQAGSD